MVKNWHRDAVVYAEIFFWVEYAMNVLGGIQQFQKESRENGNVGAAAPSQWFYSTWK
jgi:hypothetical protein